MAFGGGSGGSGAGGSSGGATGSTGFGFGSVPTGSASTDAVGFAQKKPSTALPVLDRLAPKSSLQLGLLVMLAVAAFLLGIGALPRTLVPHPRAAAALAERRAVIAAGGVAALIAFVVAYFVG
jgi:hypothetical protein